MDVVAGRAGTIRRPRWTHRDRAHRRRLAVTWAIVLVVVSCGSGTLVGPSHDRALATGRRQRRPNIVFLLADDLSTNLVRYMPNLRRMEHHGERLTNFIDSLSLCCPSRASFLTGAYPHDTHVYSNMAPTGGFRVFHDRGEEAHTFATALAAAGYRTAFMGKYLNGYLPARAVDGQTPYVPPGWSEWDVAGDAYDQYGYHLTDNTTVRHFGRAPGDYLNSVLTRRARAFVASSAGSDQPFLLEVAPFTPHFPYTPAPSDAGRFPNLRAPRTAAFNRLPTDPPRWLRKHTSFSPADIREINWSFRRRVEAVQSLDRMIGELRQTLRLTGQAANTVVIVTSDNGYHTGEYRLLPGKLTAFDTDIRVPFVVTGPGVVSGSRNPALVQNVDLAPTLEAIGHARIPKSTDGRSFLPLLHGDTPPRWPTLAYVEQHGPLPTRADTRKRDPDFASARSGNPPTYRAIRSATYTYVKYANGDREYYNLRTDPSELHNIAASLSPSRRRRLNREVAALRHCHGAAQCQRARYVRNP